MNLDLLINELSCLCGTGVHRLYGVPWYHISPNELTPSSSCWLWYDRQEHKVASNCTVGEFSLDDDTTIYFSQFGPTGDLAALCLLDGDLEELSAG